MDTEPKHFYDPHPGFAGAAAPIPVPLKTVADGLVGKTMTIARAIELLKAAMPTVEIEDVPKYGMILAKVRFGNGGMHAWRVIRYRSAP